MRERRGMTTTSSSSPAQRPITRSHRDQGHKFTHSGLVVEVMESVPSPCSTVEAGAADVSTDPGGGGGNQILRRHVVVSEPLDRNLDAATRQFTFNDQPARMFFFQ